MEYIEKENAELKRRIELISSLRQPVLQQVMQPTAELVRGDEEFSRAASDKSYGSGSVAMVDSAWSQAQAFGSDAGSNHKRIQAMLNN